jgi:hypothetical protein
MRLAGALVLVSAVASAQPATTLFVDGRKLLEQGKPAEACAKFQAALELDARAPGVLLNLGLCNEQQHKIASALKWFRRALTLAAESGMTEVETAAKAKAAALAAQVATLHIEVPAGVKVTIDGAEPDPTLLAHFEIDPGTHVIVARGSAYEDSTQTIEVRDAPATTAVDLQLHAKLVDRGAGRRHAAWLVGGGGGVLVIAAGVIGFVGREKFDGTHDLATRQRWKTIVRDGGTATFAVGAAAIAAAVVLYATAPKAERMTVAPDAAPDHVGVSLIGTF